MGTTGSKDKLQGSASMSGMSAMASGAGGMAGGETGQSPELKCAVPVHFRWHHGAQREVYVVGSFSNWQTKIRLTREDDGHFGTVMQIVPGIHQVSCWIPVAVSWLCCSARPSRAQCSRLRLCHADNQNCMLVNAPIRTHIGTPTHPSTHAIHFATLSV